MVVDVRVALAQYHPVRPSRNRARGLDVQRLDVGDDVVLEAADFLGLSVST